MVNFPAPIIFALILNEITSKKFKKTIQTISYMPYFISAVVACGLVVTFVQVGGPISTLASAITGGTATNLLNEKRVFLADLYFDEYVAGAWIWFDNLLILIKLC